MVIDSMRLIDSLLRNFKTQFPNQFNVHLYYFIYTIYAIILYIHTYIIYMYYTYNKYPDIITKVFPITLPYQPF